MKIVRVVAISMLIMLLACVGPWGCQKAADKASDYTLYTFDTTDNSFYNLGTRLSFDEDKTSFTLNFNDTLQLFGAADKITNGYLLQLQADVYTQALQAINALDAEQKKALDDDTYKAWASAIILQQQVFFYDDYVFGHDSIDLMRRSDGTKSSYTSVEGYYDSMSDAESIYLFKEGKIYANVKDEDGKAKYQNNKPVMNTLPSAVYELNHGFIIFTRVDSNGQTVLVDGRPSRIVYLLASITYPDDIADVLADNDFGDEAVAFAKKMAGKSVGLLTKTFYSRVALDELDFN